VSFESSAPARILLGDCVAEMAKIAAGSVDLVFADPPYNLSFKATSNVLMIRASTQSTTTGTNLRALRRMTTSPAPGSPPAAAP